MTTASFPLNAMLYEILRHAEKHPNWKECYPRHYHTQPGYFSVKMHASQCLGSLLQDVRGLGDLGPSINGDQMMMALTHDISRSFVLGGCQYFWLGDEIGRALRATEPLEDQTLSAVPWPFPCFAILLPYGLVGTATDAVAVCVVSVDTNLGKLFLHCITVTKEGNGQDVCVTYNLTDTWKGSLEPRPFLPCEQFSANNCDDDEIISQEALRLAINACWYMSSTSTGAVETSEIGGKQKIGREKTNWWTPRWVGRRYTLRTPAADPGTHASPKLHWRRGHFRRQRIGEGRVQVKVIWIEPILVGAKAEEEG